jgi:addiction module HigA family antidote
MSPPASGTFWRILTGRKRPIDLDFAGIPASHLEGKPQLEGKNDDAHEKPAASRHSIKDACLEPLGLSVTEAANALGIARHTLSRVLNGHAGISPEMAIRLEKAGWSNADHWLRLQTAYDLAQARQHERGIKVRRYELHPAPN